MFKTLTTSDIAHALMDCYATKYTSRAAYAVAEWLEEYEDSTGETMELDPVAIGCDFAEYDSLEDWADDYFGSDSDERPEDDDGIRDFITDNGTLIEFEGGIIVSSF